MLARVEQFAQFNVNWRHAAVSDLCFAEQPAAFKVFHCHRHRGRFADGDGHRSRRHRRGNHKLHTLTAGQDC